ncbi:hypothetical protein Droror1_Dr00007437 [Drosera rotundifolia]
MMDEPVTPAGRLFLLPDLNQIIIAAIGVSRPIDVAAIKAAMANSLIMKHPRFSSLLMTDDRGRQRWQRMNINLDDHIITRNHYKDDSASGASESEMEDIVNEYMAEFAVSSPLSMEKPLWEVHVISDLRCLIWRVHHALGDGISLMSMFLECCRTAADPTMRAMMAEGEDRKSGGDGGGGRGEARRRNWRKKGVSGMLKLVWFTLVYVLEAIGRAMWVRDKTTVLSGGAGVQLWPRKIATARFSLDDMKTIKRAIPRATINDVLFGIISCGLSKYLEVRSESALQEGLRITGLALVNLRKQPGLQEMSDLMKRGSKVRWGNRFGYIVLPVYYHKATADGPLSYVRTAKAMINRKKQSLEAYFSHAVGNMLMSCFGPKAPYRLINRITCNTTFTFSNVLGPKEQITLIDNPVTYMRFTTSALPHAISMSMLSYKGRANMQILAAKDIIPDPEFLARCFEDALLQMKGAVEGNSTKPLEV